MDEQAPIENDDQISQPPQLTHSDYEGGDEESISVSTDEDDKEDLLQAEEEDKRIMFEAIERVKQQQDQ